MRNQMRLYQLLVAALSCGIGLQVQASDQATAPAKTTKPSSKRASKESNSKIPGLGEYVSFPSCGIKIRQPKGFQKATSFDGFEQPDTISSIMVTTLPSPYKAMSAGFTAERIKQRGWKLLSRRTLKVADRPGLLLHLEVTAGDITFIKFSLVFGDDKQTVFVNSAMPEQESEKLSKLLEAAVLSTQPDQSVPIDPLASLPFTLSPSSKLKIAKGINRTILLTKDGKVPNPSPTDPLFLVGQSMGKTLIDDQRAFAERRLRGFEHMRDLAITSTNKVSVAGLSGYESFAEAVDEKSRSPVVLYQMILFREEDYFLMAGLVGKDREDVYMPEFKSLARGFRLKQK